MVAIAAEDCQLDLFHPVMVGHFCCNGQSLLCTRGYSQRFRRFPAHLSTYLNSFFPATTRIWNNLPVSAIEARNIDDFKQRIVEYFCTNSAID